MLNEIVVSVVSACLDIFLSVQFGAFLIAFGSTIYAPTGNRIGKYCLLFGLFIFTLNNLIIDI